MRIAVQRRHFGPEATAHTFRADRRLFDRRDGLFRMRHAKLAGDAEPVARDTGVAVDLLHAIPPGYWLVSVWHIASVNRPLLQST